MEFAGNVCERLKFIPAKAHTRYQMHVIAESYTREWTQMIDCGGLYQVKDEVSRKTLTWEERVRSTNVKFPSGFCVASLVPRPHPAACMILKAIRAGVGFRSGTETTWECGA